MDSHIQMTKFLMKQFSQKNGKILYLNLENNEIAECSRDNLGTAKDYYSKRIEGLLNKKVEDKFARFINKIIRFYNGNEKSISFPLETENTIRSFVRSAASRSELALSTLYEGSQIATLMPEVDKHDWLMEHVIEKNNKLLR